MIPSGQRQGTVAFNVPTLISFRLLPQSLLEESSTESYLVRKSYSRRRSHGMRRANNPQRLPRRLQSALSLLQAKLDHHSNHDPNSPKTVDQYLSFSAVSYSKTK
jgi:hypothetical protein